MASYIEYVFFFLHRRCIQVSTPNDVGVNFREEAGRGTGSFSVSFCPLLLKIFARSVIHLRSLNTHTHTSPFYATGISFSLTFGFPFSKMVIKAPFRGTV